MGTMVRWAVPKPASIWWEAGYSDRHGPEGSMPLFPWNAAGLCPF